MDTEQQILAKILQGDRKAMASLYHLYAGYATAVTHRYLSQTADARDVLQESFLKIFANIRHFHYKGEGSVKAWMLRIVSNEAINSLRSQAKVSFTDEFPDEMEEVEPEVEDIPPDIINRMVGQLPPGYRVVLNLFVFEHKSHKEIAQQLGIKEDTSASQFCRAKKMLAKMIKDYQNQRYDKK